MKKILYGDLAGFNGEEFIENCYLRLLHRQVDPTGKSYFSSRLEAGEDKAIIIGALLRSDEGRQAGEQVSGLWTRYVLRRLERLPIFGSRFARQSIEVDRALRAIDNQLHRLIEASAAPAASARAVPPRPQLALPVSPSPQLQSFQPPPVVAAVKPGRPSIFLVVDSTGSPVTEGGGVPGRIGRAFVEQGESVFFVRWNTETRNFQLVTRHDLDGLELVASMGEQAAIHPVSSEIRIVIETSSCGADDWLLVPETVRVAPDKAQLVEMDMIIEAKRLGLRSAFIFHGAEPLRSRKHSGRDADAHEQHMQALLLADAVMPVSILAANDLKAFFVQHQKADSVPLIWEIPMPAQIQGGATSPWSNYVAHIRSSLTDAAEKTHRLASLYYWIDPAAPPDAARYEFARRLAGALTEREIALIPVAWDAGDKRLVSVEGRCPVHWAQACAPGSWAGWIEPGQADAPQWVFCPEGAQGGPLADVADFARTRRLRTSVVLHDSTVSSAHERILFEAVTRIDKVLAVSERRFREFHRFLLSWRGKVHSAEHRFKALVAPNQLARSWHNYAREIEVELATDRLTDGLHPVGTKAGGDIYSTLVNLRRRPKLSLCISTFNRAGWVGVNLRNIFAQIAKPRNDLEILVVDNASADHTQEVVKPYLTRPDFRYVRNPKNIGMLGNLAVTAQRARGEYVWILGDDDLTRPGAIERVLQITGQHPDIGLIYLNYGYSSEANPDNVIDLASYLASYNILEPAGPDEFAPVKHLAAKCENFFTAIYSHVYRRDHALKAYCQNVSGRIFSTMLTCVPTAYYVLNYMAEEPAYWIGEPSLVVNSNVSWQAYGVLLDLEQLPRAWDLAERMGTDPGEVDRRRANRLWLVEMMWKEIFDNDKAGNSAYFSAARVLMRLKHLKEIDSHIPALMSVYERALKAGHPAAVMPAEELFSAFGNPPRPPAGSSRNTS